ncbi:anaerobic ribonucleoside-triphosphate reductase activating protein [Thalassomonas haliotis]|uniref:Anaerobic ribonucleoside-triphosphate reductase activating protein n=1 Tax=Thalassomonas haliotis TaxID=485448 RepID=A0ABY7V9S1_9GAMM|nr:anaerobic ribonucleoside-triphosphate reductase activating protein [Thalassomonas haliotis]WDE10102.1 anaerobic ribonucleoside-triphosphate reductase activating protein [Thalassomonas haliotis]
MTFNCLTPTIVFQEVPGEISLCFSITGCKLGCHGCHSTELWNENNGEALSKQSFHHYLAQYAGLLSCVVFFGGEWQAPQLIEKLKIARSLGLKTCLYSGQQHIDISISEHLTYLKTGKWDPKRGGLDNPGTNQAFFDLSTGKKLNHLFVKSAGHNSADLTPLSQKSIQTNTLQETKGNLHAAA